MQKYYQEKYAKAQFDADLQRKDRLRFCFPSNLEGKRVVTVGSGPGVDIEFLVPQNEVHAIDIMDEPLSIAASKGMQAHTMDLNTNKQLPFESQSVDVVVATDILEHLFEPMKALIEIRRLLTEDGFALLSVPNHFFWRMRLRILRGGDMILPFHRESKQWDYFHIRFFTSKGFERMLAKAGFRITQRYYDRFITVPKGLPRSIDQRLGKRFPDMFSMHFIVKAVRE